MRVYGPLRHSFDLGLPGRTAYVAGLVSFTGPIQQEHYGVAITEERGYVEFACEVTETEGLTIVQVAGELDLATAPQLRECLTQPEVLDASAVRIDLSKVAFLGSTGIGLLVAACKRARTSGGSFQITGSRGMAQRTIEISGLTEYFELDVVPGPQTKDDLPR